MKRIRRKRLKLKWIGKARNTRDRTLRQMTFKKRVKRNQRKEKIVRRPKRELIQRSKMKK